LYKKNSKWEIVEYTNTSNLDLNRYLVGTIRSSNNEIILVGGKLQGIYGTDSFKFNTEKNEISLDKEDSLVRGMAFSETCFIKVAKNEFVNFSSDSKASLIRLIY
jgi:hypothetical protein